MTNIPIPRPSQADAVKDHSITIRLSLSQRRAVDLISVSMGYRSTSKFIRDLLSNAAATVTARAA